MTKGRKIVGIWPAADIVVTDVAATTAAEAPLHQQADTAADPDLPLPIAQDGPDDSPDSLWLNLDEPLPARPRFGWVMPVLLTLASLGWAAFALWSQSAGFTTLPAMAAWPTIAVMICAPVALIMLGALLMERTSGRSVARHLDTLSKMREEHHHLAERLSVIDQHMTQAQTTLNDRALTMADTALHASQRLNEVSAALDERMARAVQEAAAINSQSESTVRAMDALLVALPKISEVSQRASEAMRESGQSAYQYGGQLEAQIAAVRHESLEAGTAISALNDRLGAQRDAALAMVADLAAAIEQNVATSEERLVAARSASAEAAHGHIAAIDAALTDNGAKAAALAQSLADAAEGSIALETRMRGLTDDVSARLAALEGTSAASLGTVASTVASLQSALDALGDNSMSATQSAEQLAQRAGDVIRALEEARQNMDEALPATLERLKIAMEEASASAATLPETIGVNARDGAVLLSRLHDAERSLEAQSNNLEVIEARMTGVIGAQTHSVEALRIALDALAERMRDIASQDADTLKQSLSDVDAHARSIVESTAGQLETALSTALDKATGHTVDERLASIAQASDQAVTAASAASERLMRQLITIADSSAALESRASEVHATIEIGSRDTLARQMALLKDAMQSSAVDLARLLDTDVADQAWEAYLKGDRSIFARRTLRLLDAAEAKDILRRYENEEEFRALVNRYVHDFEEMLRAIIDTRDGAQLSVTILSSDIGKIYVALAQAIERLRG
ncbi:MAG: hypothetical protein ABL874_01680 [Sphingopyxis sp.]